MHIWHGRVLKYCHCLTPPLLLVDESGSPVSCSATLGVSSSWSHFVMAMYSLQSGCVSLTSATCRVRMHTTLSIAAIFLPCVAGCSSGECL